MAPEQDALRRCGYGERWQLITQLMQSARSGCNKKQVRGRATMLLDERSANMVNVESDHASWPETAARQSWHR